MKILNLLLLISLSSSVFSCRQKGDEESTQKKERERQERTESSQNLEERSHTTEKHGGFSKLEGQERNGSFPLAAKAFLKNIQDDLITKIKTLDRLELLDQRALELILNRYSIGPRHMNPKDVSTEFIIKQIKDMRFDNRHHQKDVNRIFNYGKDSQGMFIRATKNFLTQYNSYSESYAPKPVVLEVQRMIIHEISHLWGFQEREALDFSQVILKIMKNHILGNQLIITKKLLKVSRKYPKGKTKLKRLLQLHQSLGLKDVFQSLLDSKVNIDKVKDFSCKDPLSSGFAPLEEVLQTDTNLKFKHQAIKFNKDIAIIRSYDKNGDIDYFICVAPEKEKDFTLLHRGVTRFSQGNIYLQDIISPVYTIPQTQEIFKQSLQSDFIRIRNIYSDYLQKTQLQMKSFIKINPKRLPQYQRCRKKYGQICLPLFKKMTKIWDESGGYFTSAIMKMKKIAYPYRFEVKNRKLIVDKILAYYIFEMIEHTKPISLNEEKTKRCARKRGMRRITLCGIDAIQDRVAQRVQELKGKEDEFLEQILEHELLIERYQD